MYSLLIADIFKREKLSSINHTEERILEVKSDDGRVLKIPYDTIHRITTQELYRLLRATF